MLYLNFYKNKSLQAFYLIKFFLPHHHAHLEMKWENVIFIFSLLIALSYL